MKSSTRLPCHANTYEDLFESKGKAWAHVFESAASQGKSFKLCIRIADRFKGGGGKRKMKKKEKVKT